MTKKRNPLTVSVSSEDVERKHPYLVFSLKAMAFVLAACVVVWSCWKAYDLRLTPVRIYGMIIHGSNSWMMRP